jgi:hypothetical protein
VYHLFHRLFVIFAKINDSRIRFEELIAAGSVKKAAAGADDRSVDSPFSIVACDR